MTSAVISTEPVTRPYGSLTIVASRPVDGGYAINVFTGPIREDALCFTTADRDTYRLAYAVIRDGGIQGVRPDGIHAALVDALTRELHMVQRRHDTPSVNRIEHLNQALDQLDTPADRAALTELAATVTTALADLAQHGTPRQVAPTMAGAHLAKLTEAQRAALAAHSDGTITPGQGITRPTLKALARKGYGTIAYTGARRRISHLVLNTRGLREAGRVVA